MTHSLPEGLSEQDFEAIEAAVNETARGRWFLAEFARRHRAGEMRQVLDALGRIEQVVGAADQKPALPPADPSVRLLMQRIKEVSGQLDRLATSMRDAGVDERFAVEVAREARAVAGLVRGPAAVASPAVPPPALEAQATFAADLPTVPAASLPSKPASPVGIFEHDDPRLVALARLDQLTLTEKLVLFA